MTNFHTPAELAEKLSATPDQVLEWRRQYGWPSLKIGKTIRFTDEHVEQIVAQHSARPRKSDVVDPAAAGIVLSGQTKRSARRSA